MNVLTEYMPLTDETLKAFKDDVFKGLSTEPKALQSKYFYDAQGDELFKQIMQSPEYYLTDCELEIFREHCEEMTSVLRSFKSNFDLIELGAGDASKSFYLLKCLMSNDLDFTYIPIDISSNIINMLNAEIPERLPGIRVEGIQGDYFEALKKAAAMSGRPKLIMFLGGNIGNMSPDEAQAFCVRLRQHLSPGDLVLMGYDLKKDPWVIFNAYNDQAGITEKFNLNLLSRINRDLGGDFILSQFHHYENYDPETGACKSYLISKTDQTVTIDGHSFSFRENEYIFTETSHKYTEGEIEVFASASGFAPVLTIKDSKNWFSDVIWRAV
ncbi:MAG: L-histidine N(alpha)-methyltransferase [Arcticibacter sp.]